MEGRKTKEYNAVPRQLLARKDKTKIAKITVFEVKCVFWLVD